MLYFRRSIWTDIEYRIKNEYNEIYFLFAFFQIINMPSLDKLDKFRQVYLFYNQKIYVYACHKIEINFLSNF